MEGTAPSPLLPKSSVILFYYTPEGRARVSTYDDLRCGLGDSSFNTTFLVVPF